ncbi:PAS domain S-box protein [Prosthecobacter sp.]|uniref:PAS domain S-box protein n=1 Tax=Prosthecobacter sp. TaxID=1965333 RepID=UPI003783DF18
MKKQRDPSLQIRLATIAILGLLIVLAAVAYLSGRQVKEDSNLIAEDAVPGTIDAHYMRMAISRSIGWVLVAASAQTPESRDAGLKTVHEADVAFAAALQQYETTIILNPVADRALLELVKTSYAEFYKQLMAYETLILAGDRSGAAAFLEKKLLPAFLPAIKSAEDLIKYNHGNTIALSGSIRHSVNLLYWAVAVVVVLALACAVVLVSNLTIRRRELAELQENEEKFAKAFQANPSGIAITEVETGRYIEVNETFCKILGYPPQEVIGYTTLDKGIWQSAEEQARMLQPLLNGGSLHNLEIQVRTRYGVRKTVTLNAELIVLAEKRCLMTLIEDITERKQATEQNELLKVSIDKHFDAAYWMDSSNNFVYVNDSACSSLGYTREELLGRSISMVAPKATPQALQNVWTQLRESGFLTRESTHRRKDGSEFPVEIVASYVRFEGREFNCGFARDITERKELRRKQAEMAAIVESSDDAIIGKSVDGVITSWNCGAEKVFGYTAAETIGRPLLMIFPPERESEEADILARIKRGETVEHFDTERICKDGRRINISATISPLKDGSGTVIGASKIARDITAQKHAENALARSEELLRNLIKHTPAAVAMFDTEMRYLQASDRWIADYHLEGKTVIGRSHYEVFPDIPEHWKEIHRLVLRGNTDRCDEAMFPRADGGVEWLQWEVRPWHAAENVIGGLIMFTQVITERKHTELKLRESEELFRTSFENATVGVCLVAKDGRFLKVNRTWCAMLGYTEAELLQLTFTDVTHNEDKEIGCAFVGNALAGGPRSMQVEKRYIHKNGAIVWAYLSTAIIEQSRDQGCYLISYVQDITERKLAEAALREKQAQLLLAMDIARLAQWEFDVGSNLVTADEHIFQLLGTTAQQEGGLAMSPEEYIRRFVHPEDAGIVASEVALGVASEDPNFARQFEHRIIRRDGAERVMLMRCRILLDEKGRTGKILGTNQDITEQKQAELRIRQLNRVYEVLSDINKTIVREKDPQKMLAEACRIVVEKGGFRMAWVGMFDAASQKVRPVASAGVVEGYLDQVNIDLRDKARNCGPSGRCLLSGEHVTCSDMENDPLMEAWRDEALKRGYRSSASFPLRAGGEVCGVFTLYSGEAGFFNEEETLLLDELAMDIGFALDVSESEARRRQAEQELRWRTAFFEAQVHSAIDGILVVDTEGKKLLQNRRMNELWKIPPPIADDPDDSRQLQFVLGQVKEPEVFLQKISHLNAHPDESSTDVIELVDGTTLERHSAPVRGRDGTYYGRVWTFHDITERKKLEAQFLRAQRMESIGTLASGVAHDLNNILTPIMMSAAVLRMKIADEKRAGLLDTIEMSAARGAQIVKQVLAFGRGLEGEMYPLQIEMLLTEMEQMIRSTFPKDITVECVSEPHLWLVLGDATQLHQVLLNLCVNARDAMPEGGTLRLSAANLDIDTSYASMLPEMAPGPHVLLEVSDSGTGIPPEILERIFDPFFTTKEVGKGTGLGLSTVHGIVKSHGGLLKVVSAPGNGTTFQIYLPAAPNQESIEDAAAAPPPTGHEELVLVVDDESAITHSARTVLEANGYRVLLANSAIEALVLYTEHSKEVALVLTDLMMPGMNGVLFLRTLRKINPGLLVIASSGLCNQAQLDTMKSLGVEAVLHKPYNSNMLLRTIDGVLHPKA